MKRGTLQAYDDIFCNDSNMEEVIMAPLEELHDFEIKIKEEGEEIIYKHPFKVVIDERMEELAEDIKRNGVIQPGLVIPREEGGYTLIAGHRRKCASSLAGNKEMPVRVKKLSAQEAIDYMYGSNLQRPEILPSEKAKSYLMIYGAYKKQGSRTDLTKKNVGMKKLMEEETAATEGESVRTIYRYIALANLIDPLLDMVDSKYLKVTTAYELSFLSEEEQRELLKIIHQKKIFPSGEQAKELHEISKQQKLTSIVIEALLKKKKAQRKLTLQPERVEHFFPVEMPYKERENIIYSLLEKWKAETEQGARVSNLPGQIDVEQWDDGKYIP